MGIGMRLEHLSELRKKLSRAPGINGRDETSGYVVLALLVPVDDEYHFVFEKRHASIRQGGEICFPGGEFDPQKDRDVKRTAIRETVEEMGIPAQKIKILGRLDTLISPMRAIVDVFLGTANVRMDEFRINREEVEEVFAIPVSFFEKTAPETYSVRVTLHSAYLDKGGKEVVLFPAREMNLPEKYHREWDGGGHRIYVYRVQQGVIWGLTARIVRDIVMRLKS
jgi:8-oxo-dGTP pyrophosphatase MutT (NUDIX family)